MKSTAIPATQDTPKRPLYCDDLDSTIIQSSLVSCAKTVKNKSLLMRFNRLIKLLDGR